VNSTAGAETMLLDISDEERAFLIEVLTAKQNSMLHEINHTDTLEFKETLKRQFELLEKFKSRIERPAPSPATN
jgi:uncharacterized protein YutE (UPF0331/DUF86 family)